MSDKPSSSELISVRYTTQKRSPHAELLGLESLEQRTPFDASGTVAEVAAGEPEPTFSLKDVNTKSSTYNRNVSPRDYLGTTTTAWYFIHST